MFLLLLVVSAVPPAGVGPSLIDDAPLLDAPIANVTVFSDRARVRRRVSIDLGQGARPVRFPDLPGSVLIDTVRVTAEKGKVLRVEASPVERERISIDQVDGLLDRLEALTGEIARIDVQAAADEHELGLLEKMQPAPPVAEEKRFGLAVQAPSAEAMRRVVDFVTDRGAADRAHRRSLAAERKAKLEEMEKLKRELSRYNLGAFTDRRIQVAALIEGSGTRETIELEYFVPGGRWMPAYDLHFSAEEKKVGIDTAGLVTQATGEDWTDVELALSTAIPGQGIEVPELLTWTLGESRDFVPRPRAAEARPPIGELARPVARMSDKEIERKIEIESLSRRMSSLAGAPQFVQHQKLSTLEKFDDAGVEGDLVKPEPSMPVQSEVATAAPHRGASDLSMSAGIALSQSSSREESYRYTALGLLEPAYYAQASFQDPRLPAVSAGGLDYVYQARARASIPSTGKEFRVPLASETYPVAVYYEVTPSLEPVAYLKATVMNKSERPVLLGPAAIFVGKVFAGEGTIRTTGPGGAIDFPLGADESIRVARTVVPETKTEGLFSKSDITTYRTTIEIGNYKKEPIDIGVVEPLPKTNNDRVKIELARCSLPPSKGPDEDGIMRWKLNIPAGKTQSIEIEYRIKRPAGWQMYQR